MYAFVQCRVADYMSRDPKTVTPDTRLGDAQAIFEEHRFNGMPVVDDAGVLLGMLTKIDVLSAFTLEVGNIIPPYAEIMDYKVASVMSRDVVSVPPDAHADACAATAGQSGREEFPGGRGTCRSRHDRPRGCVARAAGDHPLGKH